MIGLKFKIVARNREVITGQPKYEHTIKDRYWKYLIPTAANRIKNERRSELL